MNPTLRNGLIYLAVCLIAGVLLLFYAIGSAVSDLGNSNSWLQMR